MDSLKDALDQTANIIATATAVPAEHFRAVIAPALTALVQRAHAEGEKAAHDDAYARDLADAKAHRERADARAAAEAEAHAAERERYAEHRAQHLALLERSIALQERGVAAEERIASALERIAGKAGAR